MVHGYTILCSGRASMYIALLPLALSGFLSSTVLPGSSEAAFVAYLIYYPEAWALALGVVTVANTAGSLTSYAISYFIPHKEPSGRAIELLNRFGTPLLFFSFVPFVGDLLPLAAGWIKMPVWRVSFFIAAGKFARYCVIAYAVL